MKEIAQSPALHKFPFTFFESQIHMNTFTLFVCVCRMCVKAYFRKDFLLIFYGVDVVRLRHFFPCHNIFCLVIFQRMCVCVQIPFICSEALDRNKAHTDPSTEFGKQKSHRNHFPTQTHTVIDYIEQTHFVGDGCKTGRQRCQALNDNELILLFFSPFLSNLRARARLNYLFLLRCRQSSLSKKLC